MGGGFALSQMNAGAITIGQLIALNDEMAALVNAGVPLDRGLLALGRDSRGRMGKVAVRLGERLERGENIDAALAAEGRNVPSFYRSVVAAGLRSGRLSSALEGLAVYARNFAETRRSIALALVYPVMVLLLAYALFILFVLLVAPRMVSAFVTFRVQPLKSLTAFGWLRDHPSYWVPVVPAFLFLMLAWWVHSGRAATLRPGRLSGLFRFIPGLGSILAQAQAADFADLLALMIENGVPLGEALLLAANATGAPPLMKSASRLADGLKRGESLASSAKGNRALPSMLIWVLTTAESVGSLSPALKHAAETYRQRAARRSEAIKSTVPALFLCLIGAVAVIGYTCAVLQPVLVLWRDLAIPLNE